MHLVRLGFYPGCVPYQGPPDPERQRAIANFIATSLGLPLSDVGFAEEPIAGSPSVQPGVTAYKTLDIGDASAHEQFVRSLEDVLRAVGIAVVDVVVQQLTDPALAGLVGAAIGGTAGGAAGAQSTEQGGMGADVLLGAVLGFLLGGMIGKAVMQKGPVVGIWVRGSDQRLQWQPSGRIVGNAAAPRPSP